MKKIFMVLFVFILLAISTGAVSAAPGSAETETFVPDEILVKFVPGTSAADTAMLHRSQGASLRSEIPGIGVQVLQVPYGRVPEKVAAYEKNPNVVYAEPNYIRNLQEGPAAPADPGFADQWALHNVGQTGGTLDADIDWLETYDALLGAALDSVIIAVIDTGVDLDHPDLKLVPGWDIIGGDDDPSDEGIPFESVYGHGTHVAGIAAAVTNNGMGVAGVAFDASIKVMPIRIFDANGRTTISAISNGLHYAADHGAKVINMSYGGIFRSRTEADAVRYAWNKGAVLVAAAGNDATTLKSYPAAYPEVMAVSATNHNDSLTSYSNYGSWLSVAAPGGDDSNWPYSGILSTYPDTYAWWGGTSMAAPHVSGLASLLFAQDPSRSNSEVRAIIEQTACDLGAVGFDSTYGYGRIDTLAAVQYGSESPPPPPPPPSEEEPMHVESITFSSKAAGPNNFLYTTVLLKDSSDNPLEGAGVEMTLAHETGASWNFSGVTGADGTVTFSLRKAPAGNYSAMVKSLVLTGYYWDMTQGVESANYTLN
jgi:thermitase